MGISFVYRFHENNDVARHRFCQDLLLKLTAAGCHRAHSRSLASSMRCLSAGLCMSITTYLDDFDADLEMKRVLEVALEMTRVSLGLVDKFADGIIANRIIELGKAGERNPDILCEGALKALRGQLFGD
jgi:hypothetical protein